MTTLRLARAIVESGRGVDLAGLDGELGVICALSLDAGLDQRQEVVANIWMLLQELDKLAEVLRAAAIGR
jgi:hypothetical protein